MKREVPVLIANCHEKFNEIHDLVVARKSMRTSNHGNSEWVQSFKHLEYKRKILKEMLEDLKAAL